MTENELERTWRDNRIHRVVEGSNEVMHSFIFAYGGKQLAEQMLGIQEAVAWRSDETPGDNLTRIVGNALDFRILSRAVPLAAQLFLGLKPAMPDVSGIDASLAPYARRLARLIPLHSRAFKRASRRHREEIIQRQAVQSRLSTSATYLFAMTCALSRMDAQVRRGERGILFQRDRAAFEHFFDLGEIEVLTALKGLVRNADESMRRAADAIRRHNDTLPNSEYYIHEASPVAAGTGKSVSGAHVAQFPGDDGSERQPDAPARGVGGNGRPHATEEER